MIEVTTRWWWDNNNDGVRGCHGGSDGDGEKKEGDVNYIGEIDFND
jgi:hypothetical protein